MEEPDGQVEGEVYNGRVVEDPEEEADMVVLGKQEREELRELLESFTRCRHLPAQYRDLQVAPPPGEEDDEGDLVDPHVSVEAAEVAGVEGSLSTTMCGRSTFLTLHGGDECFGSWVSGRREGVGSSSGPSFRARGVAAVRGTYSGGRLEGTACVELEGGLVLEGRLLAGRLEGVVVGRGGGESLVQTYRRGRPVGRGWRGLVGGGWLHGRLDARGELEGEGLYLYPDLTTCLVGLWRAGRMKAAMEGRLVGLEEPEGRLVEARARVVGQEVYSYCPSTSTALTVPPLLADPYERRLVEVRPSHEAGAGEGVFARVRLPAGTFACFYHGVYMGVGEPAPGPSCDYTIFTDWARVPDSPSLDILPEHWSSAAYCATLGHKVNHSYDANCHYTAFGHPAFGHTAIGIRTSRQVEQGEELFTNYRYDINECPEWFYKLYGNS
jgi:hypothetical protein